MNSSTMVWTQPASPRPSIAVTDYMLKNCGSLKELKSAWLREFPTFMTFTEIAGDMVVGDTIQVYFKSFISQCSFKAIKKNKVNILNQELVSLLNCCVKCPWSSSIPSLLFLWVSNSGNFSLSFGGPRWALPFGEKKNGLLRDHKEPTVLGGNLQKCSVVRRMEVWFWLIAFCMCLWMLPSDTWPLLLDEHWKMFVLSQRYIL